tara:strand:+ start:1427 stop:3496 length:2070 start_codon:yes stop_codon:yes gene_type:complete
MSFETAFKNIDDKLRKESGCATELDYIEQTSWLLFLKYINDYEIDLEKKAKLSGNEYTPILEKEFSWYGWAKVVGDDGKIDINKEVTGDDLIDFVNNKLFVYLQKFKTSAEDANTIHYKIGEIFSELKNKITDGYILRDIIDQVEQLKFQTSENKHELSALYEEKIKNMGNAGRNGGEYYTPRPLVQAIVKIINPKIGETVYDGACGSAGFLCEAYDHLRTSKDLSADEFKILQKNTLFGKEKKSLAYIIGIMNMILHGVEAPNIIHTNTLTEDIMQIQDKQRYNVILANPPFGGKEQDQVLQNFPIRTLETAYLFLEHFIKILKKGGRCGVVIKNTFLSNTDNAAIALRKELLKECNLFAVLDCPGGTFQGTGVMTVVLFFEKGKPTENIWYYQLNLDRNLGKTNPLNMKDLEEFINLSNSQSESKNSWTIKVSDLNEETYDLSVNNPNIKEEIDERTPQEIIEEIELLDIQTSKSLESLKDLVSVSNNTVTYKTYKLEDVCKIINGGTPKSNVKNYWNGSIKWLTPTDMGKLSSQFVANTERKITIDGLNNSSAKLIPAQSVILSCRAPIGHVFINEVEMSFNQGCKGLIPTNKIIVEYLYYFIFSSKKLLKDLGTGTTFKEISSKTLANIDIQIPPISEQQKIVAKLHSTLNKLKDLNEVIRKFKENYDTLKSSLLRQEIHKENLK